MTFAGVVKRQPQRAQDACSFVSPGGSTPLARTTSSEWLEQADTRDLKSRAFGREGSTPFSDTSIPKTDFRCRSLAWRNGRRPALRTPCPKGRGGSSPFASTPEKANGSAIQLAEPFIAEPVPKRRVPPSARFHDTASGFPVKPLDESSNVCILGACVARFIDTGPVSHPTAYIIARADLPRGFAAAQIAHAAGAQAPHPPETHVVILEAPDEPRLRALACKLAAAQIAHTVVEEVDPPYTGQATAIGCALVNDRRPVRKVVSNLPLLR